ncbi:unnamed protein product [Adineta steineri]|uniref:Uncharacterized protein n=1 Tax=Adineta steineri TaxID=433720 RepID=A0A813PX34_9BILA|nr:unnamed protein product [Adineta steineri]CAF0767978.1 unnamed protein product [Adineta steineri]
MYPPIKRLRTDENQDESNAGGGIPTAGASSMMDDFEMTDDELLFSATQVEQQTNHDCYQALPSSQNPSRSNFQVPVFSTQTVLQPLASEGNRTQNVNKELELERKLLMKEGQIIILEKNNRLLTEKNARLTREKCLLKTEQDEAASAREQRVKIQLDTCKSQLTFNERERSELQTRYHALETRFHESQETSNRLLREVTRLRTDKPQINSPQHQPTNLTLNHSRLLKTQLTQFSAYELLRTRTIDSSTMPISSLQIILERIRPQSITQHIWQTLVDLIFFHQHNSISIKLKQQDLTIGIDLITMTAFYQMIYNTLHLFNNQRNRITTNNNDQQQQQQQQSQNLTSDQLMLVLDACSHFLLNTVKSTESLNKQENTSTIKKQQEAEPMDDGSSQRTTTDSSQISLPCSADHHTAYYTAKGQCLTMLKYFLSHSTINKYPFALFNRILKLYTFHFKTRPTHESERRKAFCSFLISLLDQQQYMNPYEYLTAILLSILDASPDEPNWLCGVSITDERSSSQRCLCSVLITHLDSLIYLDKNENLDEYIKFLFLIYRLQLFIYDNENFHKMELDNGQCPGLCWLTLFISFGQCLSRFLFHIIKPIIKQRIFQLSIKFVKILILFSLQLQPTTCLPQQAKELQLYTNPSLWHLYELMLLYHHQQSVNESITIINKQVLDDQLCVFGYIRDVLEAGNDNHANEMR